MAQARWRRLDGAHLLPLVRRRDHGKSGGASLLGGPPRYRVLSEIAWPRVIVRPPRRSI